MNKVNNWIKTLFVTINKFLKIKGVRLGFLITVLLFALYQLFVHFKSISQLLKQIQVEWKLLFIAVLLTIVASVLGAFVWGFLMRGMGYKIKILIIARTQFISSLAKYIPGYVWQMSGKTFMSQEAGVQVSLAGLGFGMEVFFTLLSGMCIFLMVSTNIGIINFAIKPNLTLNLILIILGFVFSLFLLITPVIIKVIFKKQFVKHNIEVHLIWWYVSLGLILVGWWIIGVACFITSKALLITDLNILNSIVIISGSYVAGLLAFFAPNGLVVREAAMVALFPDTFTSDMGILLSIILRLEVIFADLVLGLSVAAIWLLNKRYKKGQG